MTFSFKCSTCSETHCHLSNRPNLELEPTDHPLAVEQREGISVGRVADIYSIMMHQDE